MYTLINNINQRYLETTIIKLFQMATTFSIVNLKPGLSYKNGNMFAFLDITTHLMGLI